MCPTGRVGRSARVLLVLVAGAIALALVPGSRRRGATGRLREPHEQHVRQAARVRDGRGGPRSTRPHSRRSRTRTAAPAPPARPGYDASVEYVIDTMEAAGWTVSTHQFDFTVAQPIRQLTPASSTTHATGGVTAAPWER